MTKNTSPGALRRRWQPKAVAVAMAVVVLASACTTDGPRGTDAASPGDDTSVGSRLDGKTGTVSDLELSDEQLTAATKAGDGQTIGIVAPLSAEYLATVVDGAKEAASELDMNTQVVDYQFDAGKGVSGIQNLVSQGVKYMVVVLTDPPAMIGAVQAAEAAGVTVVQFAGDQVAKEGKGYSVAISDQDLGDAAGEVAAEIAIQVNAKQVAILDFPSQPNVVIRADAMKAAIESGAPDVKIVARVTGGTQDTGLSASETLLQKFPDLDGIISINDAAAYGAVQAFQGAGRNGKNAFVVGCDAESKARSLIKEDGIFKATVDTQPGLTGQAAVHVIGQILAGNDVAQYTTVPVTQVTA